MIHSQQLVYQNKEAEFIEQDILGYLQQHEQKQLLRFITCGSVDDGKSTLIGRLLHDSKMIFEDQLEAVTADSKKVGTQGDDVDLALLVDGLQSEREQGITIDVAYRYFSTDKRKFIIADTPGHEQYTRNMATGCSTCDVAIILVDASKGVQTQTKRHSYICSLLGVKQLIVAVNKMDLVSYSQQIFEQIKTDYKKVAQTLGLENVSFVPMSALKGDNVVNITANLAWFSGKPLLSMLETVQIKTKQHDKLRFPVQLVCRPDANFRGFQGTLASGSAQVGDSVRILPSNTLTSIKDIVTFDGKLTKAHAGQAVTLTLQDEVDVSRGDMIVHADDESVQATQNFTAKLLWMNEDALDTQREYLFKFSSKTCVGRVQSVMNGIDINNLKQLPRNTVALNEIASVQISCNELVATDAYSTNRQTGSFIIIDRISNQTLAAGMVEHVEHAQKLTEDPSNIIATTKHQNHRDDLQHKHDGIGELTECEKKLILLKRKIFG